MNRLGPLKRSFVGALRLASRLSGGYDMSPIIEEMVRTHGIRGAVRLMKMGLEISETLTEEVGAYQAQTLISCAAVWDGCRFCSLGHMYSANLYLFDEVTKLGPVDGDKLIELMYMTDEETYQALKELYAAPDEAATWHLIDRMFRLRFQQLAPAEDIDTLLRATLSYWEWLNECTIILGVNAKPGNVPPLGHMSSPPVALTSAYAAARDAHNRSLAAKADGPAAD